MVIFVVVCSGVGESEVGFCELVLNNCLVVGLVVYYIDVLGMFLLYIIY